MKRFFIGSLALTILLVFTESTFALVNLSYGGITGGQEITDNGLSKINDDLSGQNINLTFISNYKVNLNYLFGDLEQEDGPTKPVEFSNFYLGYPVINKPQTLVYLTIGYQNYSKKDICNAGGAMLGTDVVFDINEYFLVEGELQYSLFGANYKFYAPQPTNYPLEQVTVKIKSQFNLNNNLGVVLSYLFSDMNVDDATLIRDVSCSSLGLIFKF